MPKKSKAIVPLFSNQKELLLVTEKPLIWGLNPNEQAKDQYFKDHLLDLEEEVKSLAHAKEQITYLKAFRDLLSGHCFQIAGPVTIIHCSELRKADKCKHDKCPTRNKWKSLFL